MDSHEQYDDGYETGVGDLLSNNKYKLPSLPPPSSSPYSSLSSSSISTISTANSTPTNLLNTLQQQSPSYLGGSGSSMPTHHQYQQQQQQQFQQNHQQYPPMQLQGPTHQNTFNYHHMFGRMQQQQMPSVVKNGQHVSTPEDPYRFVDDEISNGINGLSSAMMHSIHHQMSPAGMSSNYSASSSPMPPGQIQQQMAPTTGNTMMHFNEHVPLHQHHHQQHGHHHQINQQQTQPQHINTIMNGNIQTSGNLNNANPLMINDAPKKRGRKKKLRDENG